MNLTYTLSQIEAIASTVLQNSKSCTLLFHGDMGVGKTTLIKELLKQLGVTEVVQSPTFSIVNEYEGAKGEIIYHFDCYRLESEEEILDVGFEDYLQAGDWIFIEWPEKISSFLPKNVENLYLSFKEYNRRNLILHL